MTATERIRNVVLVGHHGSGKTTVAEALLARAAAVGRAGRVEDGTTVCDHEPEERKRQHSLSMAIAPFMWRDHQINLIDVPGSADFIGEALAGLDVADLAVFVVSAVEGVEPQTEVLWAEAASRDLPRFVFVNKLDRDRSSFDRTVAEFRDRFGSGLELLELPVGEAAGLHGVADLLTDQAFVYDAAGRHIEAIPAELTQREHVEHDHLVEDIVSGDDTMLERFLDGDVPSAEELERTLAQEVDLDVVFPVLCGSASLGVGIDRLADFIVEIGPSPADRPGHDVTAAGSNQTIPADPSGPALAIVFKTIVDPFVGQLSLFKVLSGTIRADERLLNVRTGNEERLHSLFQLFGSQQRPVTALAAGDIGAVAKLTATRTGDTLAPAGQPVTVSLRPAPGPAYFVAVAARTQADDDKMSTALGRLVEADPTLSIARDDETHQTLLGGAGETQLAVALERLERAFGVRLDVEPVRIAYRETIGGTATAEGKHKKQSGGHGQFGVAEIVAEALGRGGGFEFVDEVVGGAIPRQFIPAVERGIREAMTAGGIHGYPVVDLRVRCVGGKYHAVDSSEMSFRTAGALALREALAAAGSVLLEPMQKLEVTVPSEMQGDVLSDINARRGKVLGALSQGNGSHTISAIVPASELLRYALDLRSMTRGRGRFTATHDHYEAMPDNLVAKISLQRATVR